MINNNYNVDLRSNYLLPYDRTTLKKSDCIILLGLNLRLESPIYNIFLRKLVVNHKKLIISCNNRINLNYFIKSIGVNIISLIKLLEGKNLFLNILSKFKKIYMLIGNSFLNRVDNSAILSLLNYYTNFKLGIIQKNIGSIISSELGLSNNAVNNFKNKTISNINNLNLINSPINYYLNLGYYDTVTYSKFNTFTIFQGHHGSSETWFKNSNIVLPSKLFFEQNSNYLNFEGVNRLSKNILMSQKFSKDDFKIIKVYYLNNLLNSLYTKNLDKYSQILIYYYFTLKNMFDNNN